MLYSQLAESYFRNSYDYKAYKAVNAFFKSGMKMSSIDRSPIDGFAYHWMHGEFYGRLCRKLIDERMRSHGLKFERILDFGGQGGAAYEYFSTLITLDQYLVVDRWSYSEQKNVLSDLSILPVIHQISWQSFLTEQQKTDEEVLILFSFSINEASYVDQLRVIQEAKSTFKNASILVLDSAPTITGLSHLGDTAEVVLQLPRPLHCFSDGHHLRRKLSAMRLWV